jgi:hypothetical protein
MDKESFMGVLAALIVSEEFQGIVASDTGNSKLSIDASSLNAESMPSDSNNSSEGSAGNFLLCLYYSSREHLIRKGTIYLRLV